MQGLLRDDPHALFTAMDKQQSEEINNGPDRVLQLHQVLMLNLQNPVPPANPFPQPHLLNDDHNQTRPTLHRALIPRPSKIKQTRTSPARDFHR
jgi:hypothetical protein